MWTRTIRVFPNKLRRVVDAETIAAATILGILVLAGFDAIQRSKAPERVGGFDVARPAVPGIGHAHATARAADLAAKRRAADTAPSALEFKTVETSTAQAPGQTPLNGKGMLSALERMEPEVRARTRRGFHRPVTVILDATGSPALNPHRRSAQPFELKVIARVTDGIDVAVAEPATQPVGAAPKQPVTASVPRGAKAAAGADGKRQWLRMGKTKVGQASATLTAKVTQSPHNKGNKNSARVVRVANIDQATAQQSAELAANNRLKARADFSPGEITWRALRGPT